MGGPNFLLLPDGQIWAGARYIVESGEEMIPYTAIGPITSSGYHPQLILPSGGDTGYPGLVYRNGVLCVSYYSSHEGGSKIYLAKVKV